MSLCGRVPKPEKRAATKGDEAKNPTQGKPESEGSLLNHKLKKKKKKTSQPSGREEVGASGATVSSAGQKNKNKNKFKKEKGQALLPAPAEVTQETEQGKAKGKRKKLKAPDDLDDAPAAKRSGAASLLQEGAEAGSKGKGKGDGLLEQMRAKLQVHPTPLPYCYSPL